MESQPLSETVGNILEEARMILPGTRTLFGFQLIVVFNTQFHERLSPCADFYLVAPLVTTRGSVSLARAIALFTVVAALWFIMPTRAAERDAHASVETSHG